MATVNTVLGPVAADDLGATLMHEHLVLGHPGWECDALAAPYDRDVIANVCSKALEEAKAYGLKTMVDASPIDLSRDVELARMVSERTGVNIIVATGMYMEAMGKSAYFRFRGPMADTTAEMCETFVKEITQGIGDSGIKAGVIKVATGHGQITSYEERVLRAAARAQKETGVPIITHTEAGTMGPEQADMLISEGADPGRIVIGHIGGNANLQYHTSVLERGVYVAFDRLGVDVLFPDTLRKACIIGLVGIGYAGRIMLSHDHSPYWLGRSAEMPDIAKALAPNWSYSHVFRDIVPALREAGVSDEKIDSMLVGNPRRLFVGG
jgi:phosphotriesterase-related protein